MNGPIQLIPPGFLSLLGLKNQGRLPPELGEKVDPSMDMEPWYLRTNAAFVPTAVSVTLTTQGPGLNLFTTGPLVVPQDETWWVDLYTVEARAPVAAGEDVGGFAPAIQWNNAGAFKFGLLAPQGAALVSSAARQNSLAISAGNFWAPPGALLGFYASSIVAATGIVFTGLLRRTVLKI